MFASRSLGIGFAVAILGSVARSDVVIVDSSGGGQFTNLQMAVNSAENGDTLLVRHGAYSSFTVDRKALTVAAESGATVTVYGTVTVSDLLGTQKVVLSGLTVTGATTTSMADAPGTGLIATGNAGALRVDGCRFEGARGIGDGYVDDCCDIPDHHWGWHAAILDGNSAGVAFVGCTFVGGRGADAFFNCYCGTGGPGGDALRLSSGLAALYDCTLVGGRGGGNGWEGGPGGAGCRLLTSTLSGITTSGSSFQGGNGGDGYDFVFSYGGAGGDGFVMQTGTIAHIVESAMAGGIGGRACQGTFPPGPDGVDISGPGTPFYFPVPKLVLESPALVREGEVFPVTVRGRPGDEIFLFHGTRTPYRAMASWKGVLLAAGAQPQPVGILGDILASGELQMQLAFPELGPSVSAENRFLQVWRRNPIDGRTLGSFAAVTVLDSAY